MGTEPAMFANSLNELLLMLVQMFGIGIKGCEHECTSDLEVASLAVVPALSRDPEPQAAIFLLDINPLSFPAPPSRSMGPGARPGRRRCENPPTPPRAGAALAAD